MPRIWTAEGSPPPSATGDLVCITLYKMGAQDIIRRLELAA